MVDICALVSESTNFQTNISKSTLKKAELIIIRTLGWDMNATTSHAHVMELASQLKVPPSLSDRAEFFVDMSHYEPRILEYTPAVVGVASMMLARNHLGLSSPSDEELLVGQGIAHADVLRCESVLISHYNALARRPLELEKERINAHSPDSIMDTLAPPAADPANSERVPNNAFIPIENMPCMPSQNTKH